MPRIPDYQQSNQVTQPGPQLQAQSTPGLEAFGGGQALAGFQGAARLGGAAESIFAEQKKQADDALTMNAYAQALSAKNKSLYDPNDGAMNLKGADAMARAQSVRESFEKRLGEIEGGLQNTDQRALFRRMRANVAEDFSGALERHVYDQAQKFKTASSDAMMKTAIDDATLNSWKAGKVEEQLTLVKGLAREQAERDGFGGEPTIVAQREKEAGSKLASSVIDRMFATNDPRAQGYYLGIQGELTAEDRERLDKTMKVANVREESTRAADDIQAKHRDLGSALRAARELPPGEVRDQTVSRIKDYHADLKLADETRDRVRFDQAADMIQRSNGQAELTPQQLAGMKPSQIKELNEFRRQMRTGMTAEVNSDAYLDALKLSASNPGKFREMNLSQMRAQIAPSQLSELAKMQVSLRKGEDTSDLAGVRSTQAIINGNLNSMRLRARDDGAEIKQYTDEVYRRVHQQASELGRKLKPEEVQSIADKLATPVTVLKSGMLWNSSGRVYDTPTDKDVDVGLSDIPASEMRKIRQSFVIEGRPYSDEAALNKYKLSLGRFRGR